MTSPQRRILLVAILATFVSGLAGFHHGVLVTACLLIAGGLVSFAGIRKLAD